MSAWSVNLPVVGKIRFRPEQFAYYGALLTLGVLEVVEWPVTLVVATGHYLATRHHADDTADNFLAGLGEAMQEA